MNAANAVRVTRLNARYTGRFQHGLKGRALRQFIALTPMPFPGVVRLKGISWFPDWAVKWLGWGRRASEAADRHDMAYGIGGTRQAKDRADLLFYWESRAAVWNWVARGMWKGVRSGIADHHFTWKPKEARAFRSPVTKPVTLKEFDALVEAGAYTEHAKEFCYA